MMQFWVAAGRLGKWTLRPNPVAVIINVASILHSLRLLGAELRKLNHLEYFPIRHALRGYDKSTARADVLAGLNVALLAIPQGMAYAAIAGIPIQYGIYGGAIASIVGPLFTGSRFIILGPTNATSVLLFASFLGLGVSAEEKLLMIPLVVFLTGLFLVIGAFLRVANLIQYISRTVATGYITAAAIYIIVNQVRKVAGVEFDIPQGSTFFDVVRMTIEELPTSHLPTLLISALTAVLFLTLRKYWRMLPNVAITLMIMTVATAGLNQYLIAADLVGTYGLVKLQLGFDAASWGITLPPLNDEWISQVAGIALVIAFLSVLEGTSIGKSLAARSGERLQTNQEMLGMGMSNLACGLGMGMPASGSLTRSQLNFSSGAKTAFASIFCGLFCVLGVFLIGPVSHYIPVSVLGVLVITIGLSLLNRHVIRVVLKSTRSDAIVFVTTFLAALLVRLDFAIILGAATSILLFLRKAAVPELVEYQFTEEGQLAQLGDQEKKEPEISIVHVEGDLFFGASELFQDQLRRVCEEPNLKVVVLKMRNAHHLDATSVLTLEELIKYMNETDRYLIVSEARDEVVKIFRNSGLIKTLGEENLFTDEAENPTMSTAKALRRAKEVVGETLKVSIFAGQPKPKSEEEA